MDSNPWGAADDDSFSSSLPRPPSPKLDLNPTSTTSFAAPSWGADDGDGWGAAVDDYVPPVLGGSSTARVAGEATDVAVEEAAGLPPVPTLDSSSGGGWGAGSPELPKLSIAAEEAPATSGGGFAPSPPLPPVSLAAAPSSPPALPSSTLASPPLQSEDPDRAAAEEEDDGRGWGGAPIDDLPPIASLRIARPPSPSSPSTDRAAGWVDPVDASWEPPEVPVPLPSFGDAFQKVKPARRGSGEIKEDGEEAWGSAQGWEERRRIEEEQERERIEEEERLRRVAEEEREAAEAQKAASAVDAPAAPTSSLSRFLPSFKKGAGQAADAASKSAEAVKSAAAGLNAPPPPATGMSSIQGDPTPVPGAGEVKGHAGDEYDIDAPGGARAQAQGKSSWWSKKAEPAHAVPAGVEDDPRSLGAEEVKQGESGRVASPEPQQQGAVGRFLSRFKKGNAPAEGSQQQQQDQAHSRTSSENAAFDAAGFDALASGGIGHTPQQKQQQQQEDEEVDDALGGFFGDRLSSFPARRPLQVAQAPPEDDFGGLLGAFSAPPTKPASKPVSTQNKAFDPFDPLSDSFGAVSVPAAKKSMVLGRPSQPPPPVHANAASAVSSFHSLAPPPPSQPVRNSSPTGDDSFDAFFDSVVASTSKPAVPPIPSTSVSPPPVLSPQPRTRPPPPSLSSSSHPSVPPPRNKVVSPPPRIATISPPARTSTASPASSSGTGRASTPILPLAPPPPPSQPLAASRGISGAGLISIDAPPSSSSPVVQPVQRTSTPLSAAPLAPSPVGGLKPAQPSQQQPPKKASGPLSLDDLSFFES